MASRGEGRSDALRTGGDEEQRSDVALETAIATAMSGRRRGEMMKGERLVEAGEESGVK